jgi:hypothetical protein
MKTLLLAAALSMLVATAVFAEDDRDQAYGKHDMGASPDTSTNRPNSATATQGMGPGKSASKSTKHSKKLDK